MQTTQNHNRSQQPKRAADVGEEEERGRKINSNNNTNGDTVGPSGSVSIGVRRRSSSNGGSVGGGHQKRHQEWLDKFGEVSHGEGLVGSKHCLPCNFEFVELFQTQQAQIPGANVFPILYCLTSSSDLNVSVAVKPINKATVTCYRCACAALV